MDESFQYVWGEYRAWAKTSRLLKARTTRAGLIVLVLMIVGTALGTLSPLAEAAEAQASGGRTGTAASLLSQLVGLQPWLAAAALGVATFLTNQLLSESERQGWVKARALAEALKSEACKYVTGAAPYDIREEARDRLSRNVTELQQRFTGVIAESLTAEERAAGMPEGPWTAAEYAEHRIREQVERYYRPAIASHKRTVARARQAALGMGIVAVGLSAGGTTVGWSLPLLGIVTTTAASIAAWFQGGRHAQLALNYQAAVTRLELLLARPRGGDEATSAFVLEAEAIMQAEHAAWLAEWQKPNPPAPTMASQGSTA